ncbi:MAG: hypothetical protein JRI84_15545 [Deltaproteobacteria bacterium]|nr:hypothetical protein [Deltaproteobacteria bacterium]
MGNSPRVLLFMVDGALKRYNHYEGNQYPARLTDLIPKYLAMSKEESQYLKKLVYVRDPQLGYRLSLAKPQPGQMNIVISPKGIKYEGS